MFTEPAFEFVSVNIRPFEWQLHGLSKSFLLNSKIPSAACFILRYCLYFLLAPCQTALFYSCNLPPFSSLHGTFLWFLLTFSFYFYFFFFFCPYLWPHCMSSLLSIFLFFFCVFVSSFMSFSSLLFFCSVSVFVFSLSLSLFSIYRTRCFFICEIAMVTV